MTDIKLKPVTHGKLNRPARFRTRTAELGPDHKAGEGAASLLTADVYLDGERIGSVTGAFKANSTVREWTPPIHRHAAAPARTGQGFLRGRTSWVAEDVWTGLSSHPASSGPVLPRQPSGRVGRPLASSSSFHSGIRFGGTTGRGVVYWPVMRP
jgi:hypothetical protein